MNSRAQHPVAAKSGALVRLARAERGSIVAPLAVLLPILVGMVGLGVDVSNWYNGRRDAQAAADAAARAGALELVRNSSSGTIQQAAWDDAAANGFDIGNGDSVTINNPPLNGAFISDTFAVEAVVSYHPQSFFSKVVFNTQVEVQARAVAKAIALDTCVWALEEYDTGVTITGTADVVLDCGIFANSTSAEAIDQVGTSCVTASSIRTVGDYTGTCLNPSPITRVSPYPDPLAHLDPPSVGGCDYNGKVKVTGGSVTLDPGVYCKGIDVSGGADVSFNPGTYVFKGGTVKVAGNSSLSGNDVTFYLTDGAGGHADLSITATTIDFSAPDAGPMEGILFFQDRAAPTTLSNMITGNVSVELDGALYFPTTRLDFAGTSSAMLPAPMLVAREIRFVGTTDLGGNGAPPPITMVDADLVE
jgi:Flp pilus assembly protein TadG